MLDRLTLDQLRTLIAVAETGSFSGAGRKLGRVQSAISQTIQALEDTLGITLFDRSEKTPQLTDAGKSILNEARQLVAGADRLRARAESIADEVEPELTLAVDPMFPNLVLAKSLKDLAVEFPQLPVTVFTEPLGGAEERLLSGAARLGLCVAQIKTSDKLESDFLVHIAMAPVVASDHPLASLPMPIPRRVMEEHVQLILTDRTSITAGFSGHVISRRVWRFADMATRLDFLLSGSGWCNMPLHMVQAYINAGKLKRLTLDDNNGWLFPIDVVHERDRPPRKAGRWLIDDLRRNLGACPENFMTSAGQKK